MTIESCEYSQAALTSIVNSFLNTGQVCSAPARLLTLANIISVWTVCSGKSQCHTLPPLKMLASCIPPVCTTTVGTVGNACVGFG